MARIGISHHPYHIFHLIFSALQQTMCHLHALFHYVLVDRTIKTGFEALLQFSFTEIALLRNLCDCQRVKEMIVNNFPGLHQAAIIFSGNLFVIFLLPNRFFAEQGDKFQYLSFKIQLAYETYPLLKIEISNTSHPFYTGKSTLVDTAGRVDKFMSRYGDRKKK